jgi:hypothetical protein
MNKKFKFPTPVLVHEGDAILDAGEANAARINLRLPNNYLSQTRMVLDLVQHQTAQQKGEGGAIGVLTQAQEEKLDALLKLMAAVRKTAKRLPRPGRPPAPGVSGRPTANPHALRRPGTRAHHPDHGAKSGERHPAGHQRLARRRFHPTPKCHHRVGQHR